MIPDLPVMFVLSGRFAKTAKSKKQLAEEVPNWRVDDMNVSSSCLQPTLD